MALKNFINGTKKRFNPQYDSSKRAFLNSAKNGIAGVVIANTMKYITLGTGFVSIAGGINGCTTFGPTKPNTGYSGSKPQSLVKLEQWNPKLGLEISKIPEIQDGISNSEAKSLDALTELYSQNPSGFDSTFEEMYQIGKPEVRKYCSPLQALFWLVEDGKTEDASKIVQNYNLNTLLKETWILSKKEHVARRKLLLDEAKKVEDSCTDPDLKKIIDDFRKKNGPFSDYALDVAKEHPEAFTYQFSQAKIEQVMKKNELRWADFDTVIERLNTPELLDFYIDGDIMYEYKLGPTQNSLSLFKTKIGDCDDAAKFGELAMSKAGYETYCRVVYNGDNDGHIGLAVKLKDGTFLGAVNFDHNIKNRVCGPFKTILEFDKALGYESKYMFRSSF